MWCATLTTGRRENGKLRRRTVYAKERERVVEKLDELRVKRGRGGDRTSDKQKVGEYQTGWLEHTIRVGSSAGTYRLYKSTIDNHIRDRIGGYKVSELTADHVRMMLADMEMDKCGSRTRKLARDVLHKAFADSDDLERNPVASVKAARVETKERQPLTVEQTRTLLTKSVSHRIHALLVLAANTGLRQGELLALRWPDLDLPNKALHVRATLARDLDGSLGRKEPKSGSKRVVPLNEATIAVIEGHRKRQMGSKRGLCEWVFPSKLGGPMDKDDLRRSFHSLLEDLELPATRFHDLRHGFNSMLAARGIDPKTRAAVLGHSTTRMTLDVYTHADADMQRQAANKIGDILRGA